MLAICFFTLFGLLLGPIHAGGTRQKVVVSGRFVCPSDPSKAANIKVKLMEHDTLDPNDEMAEQLTTRDGSFSLSGEETEIGTIEPMLEVFHDCNDGIKPCQRKWTLIIPDRFITKAVQKETKPLDIGVWNLELGVPDEERDCTTH